MARKDQRSLDYYWLQTRRKTKRDASDTETALIATGRVTVAPLQFERTDEVELANLNARFES
jgi:5'-nucleotidase